MPKTSTRLANFEDLPVLALVERELARVAFPLDPIEDLDYHADRLRKQLGREPEGMVVMVDTDSEEVVAWLWMVSRRTLATGEAYGVVRSVYVRPSARMAGLGAILVQYALRYFRDLGIDRVVATVHASSAPAARLLEKAGFASAHVTYEWRGTPPAE